MTAPIAELAPEHEAIESMPFDVDRKSLAVAFGASDARSMVFENDRHRPHSRIGTAMEHGSLVEQAKVAFPGNRFFAGYESSTSSTAVASEPKATRLDSAIDDRDATSGQKIVVHGDAASGSMTVNPPITGDASPHHWMPQGSRWSIQVWTCHYDLRGKIKQVLNDIGFFVSEFEDIQAMQHGEAYLMGVPEQEQDRVREAVEELGLRVEFAAWSGGLHHLVEMYRERFTLSLEEVDVLHAVLSALSESEMVQLVGLSAKRVERHIRRLCLSFQVDTMAEIPGAAYAGGSLEG